MNLQSPDYHTRKSPDHSTQLPTPSSLPDMASPANPSSDVLFYVGKHRHPYHVNSDTLSRSSSYFKHLLDAAPHMRGAHPILIDCEEGIFETLLLLMRYGTFEALPPMSASESFRLKKEADFYGIRYTEPCPRRSEASHSDDGISDLSSCSSPSGSPKSMMHMSPPPARKRTSHGRYYEGIRVACATPQQLAELPEFPIDLADPSRLLLVSCLDQEQASNYTCDCVSTCRSRVSVTQWAINFHHKHAFCTACGRTPNMSHKHFAEMFMAAASTYSAQVSPGKAAPKKCAWRVSSDSTCILRFISSAGDGHDGCGCSAGGGRAEKEAPPSIWAANYFYSHAFCTCCGEVAKGPVLLSLLLTIRYGGRNVSMSSSRADLHTSNLQGQQTNSL